MATSSAQPNTIGTCCVSSESFCVVLWCAHVLHIQLCACRGRCTQRAAASCNQIGQGNLMKAGSHPDSWPSGFSLTLIGPSQLPIIEQDQFYLRPYWVIITDGKDLNMNVIRSIRTAFSARTGLHRSTCLYLSTAGLATGDTFKVMPYQAIKTKAKTVSAQFKGFLFWSRQVRVLRPGL